MDQRYLKNDFELEENTSFDQSFSKLRSIGHWILMLIIVAGLAGVFGFGVWTKKTVPLSKGIYLEYEYFLHINRETPFKIYLKGLSPSPTVDIAIQASYFKSVSIKNILPRPVFIDLGSDSVIFRFRTTANPSGFISFNTFPIKPGAAELGLSVNGRQQLVKQFIYP
jgi:hypothetical protein